MLSASDIELRAALAELVRLKDLKHADREAYEAQTDAGAKDAAWARAREILRETA